MDEKLLTPAETAEILRVTVGTLKQWRWLGIGPKSLKRGPGIKAHVLYPESGVRVYARAMEPKPANESR